MPTNALDKIRKRTKAIQRAHPKLSYQAAHKKATGEYNSGKIAGVKKKGKARKSKAKKAAPKRKAWKKSVGTAPKYRVVHEVRQIGTMPEVRRAMKDSAKVIKAELGWQYVNAKTAKTKKDKNKYLKRAKELEADLKKVTS